MAKTPQISKTDVLNELWRRADLSWKLDKNQQHLKDLYYKGDHRSYVWLLSRRSGKSYALVVLAIEECLKRPNTIVKFLAGSKDQINNIVRPLIRDITEDCPVELKPELKIKDYIYYFPNGSEIQLAGTDKGHAEKLRGGDANLVIVDEAGSCSDLKYIVKSILLPTTLITKGKIILSSTPPKEADHEFLHFIEIAEQRGSLVTRTIYDNPRLSKEMMEEIIIETGGTHTDDFRREYMCQLIKDSNSSVIPEFNADTKPEIVKEWVKPPYYTSITSMDIGFNDLTVVLFGYYDFEHAKLIIEHELVKEGKDLRLPELAKEIQRIEETLWTSSLTHEFIKPKVRVGDHDLIVLSEIARHSDRQVIFTPVKKDSLDSMINKLRVMINSKQLIISPKCTTLIRHLENVKWKSKINKTIFARSPDNGHYDAVSSLIYLVNSIDMRSNPFPSNYKFKNTQDTFIANSNNFYNKTGNSQMDAFRAIFNRKK